ncbi:hypothetical protein LTR09_007367 [Extremus antarcticus]|uniref:Uncharacterized protein n=1 Tax=Extremus antarcticus TaxID=702011 RepID=A0AAJ0DCB5_9PEZI|nr:hypothetical protein LTR09_007367 [Extremus antarcticus]
MRELSPDLADKVYTSRYPCTQFTWKTAGDSLLGRDNLDLLPIIRRILVQCLTEALPKAVRISHNTVTSVTPRPSKDAKAVVNFADGTSEVADLVVGADGIRSPVRHCLFPGEPDKAGAKYLGVCAVGGVLDVPLSKSYTDNPSILFSIGAAGVLGYCGLSKTEANKLLYFSFQKSEQMPDRTKVDYQLITKQLRERHNDSGVWNRFAGTFVADSTTTEIQIGFTCTAFGVLSYGFDSKSPVLRRNELFVELR